METAFRWWFPARGAAAVAYAWGSLAEAGQPPRAVLNTGLSAAEGRAHYPDMLFRHSLPESTLYTFDTIVESREEARSVSFDAPAPALVDMEAGGVFTAMALFLPPSRVHSLKIVGDSLSDARSLTANAVQKLMEGATDAIANFLQELNAFCDAAPSTNPLKTNEEQLLHEVAETLRLTATQKARLRDAACRHRLARGKSPMSVLSAFALERPTHKHERNRVLHRLIHALSNT